MAERRLMPKWKNSCVTLLGQFICIMGIYMNILDSSVGFNYSYTTTGSDPLRRDQVY